MTVQEVEARIAGLDEQTANNVICALVGHSKVQTVCFGYWSCARCGQQLGDTLAGGYNAKNCVAVDHHCDGCRAAVKQLSWEDTYSLPDKVLHYLMDLANEKKSKRRQAAMARVRDRLRLKLRARESA